MATSELEDVETSKKKVLYSNLHPVNSNQVIKQASAFMGMSQHVNKIYGLSKFIWTLGDQEDYTDMWSGSDETVLMLKTYKDLQRS